MRRVLLVGGGARSEAVRRIAPAVLGCPVVVPEPGEYVADGAARQAAWVLSRRRRAAGLGHGRDRAVRGRPDPAVRARYAEVRDLTADPAT